MAFQRPSLSTIIERIKSDYKSGLSLSSILARSFLDIMAKAQGGASHTLHGHIQFGIDKKFFLIDGDEETVIRWGTLFRVPRNEATFAELVINVTGTSGGTLPKDQEFVRSDGFIYRVKAEVTVPASSTVQATVVAEEAGSQGNMDVGDTLTLVSAISGIESEAPVDSIAVEADDEESIENYRDRILERLQDPPAGGKVSDYIAFAKTVTGVTRVWVLPAHLGEGTVGVTFVEDNEDPIIPSAAKVDEVQDVMDEEAPVPADVTVFAPTEETMDPTISIKPNTSEVRAAVISELEDMLNRIAEVRGAIDPEQVGNAVQFDGKIPLSKINEAISIAAGEEDHVLTSPTSDVQPQVGGLVTLGTVTFNTLP